MKVFRIFLSETYSIHDCYFVEKTSNLNGYINTNGTLTLSDGVFTHTKGENTSNFYRNYSASDFIGKTLTVMADILNITANQYRMSLFYNNGNGWSSAKTVNISETGLMENSIEIPSNAVTIRVRFDIFGETNSIVKMKNYRFIIS